MKTSKYLFLTLGLLSLASGSWADPRNPKPDWVEGSSMEYSREKYLTGVGLGDNRGSAEDRARGEIAKVFSVLVNVKTDLAESESNLKHGKSEESTFSQSISQNVQTASKKALEGVEVVETWQDSGTRQHFALAVLDRAKAILAITDKITEFDKQAQQWKVQMDQADGKLSKVKAAIRLLALLKARAELNNELRVLDAGGKTISNPLDEAQLRPQTSKAISELDVVIDMSGGSSDEVETGIIKGLSDFGLQAKAGPAGQPCDILIDGKVQTRRLEEQAGRWRWARSTVTLSIKDGATLKTFVRLDTSDRQASADYEEAVRRTHVAIAKKVASQVNEAVTSYFENQ